MRSIRNAVPILMLGLFFPGILHAQAVLYELLPGSTFLNDCPICDRIPIVLPLEGTFVLTRGPSETPDIQYQITDIDFQTRGGDPAYTVSGGGNYTIGAEAIPTQQMSLRVEINGEAGIELEGKTDSIDATWPFLDIAVVEVTSSETRVYHIHIVASPRPSEIVPYKLLKGSEFLDDCTICGKPLIPIPIEGTFQLGKVDENPLFTTYRVEEINFKDSSGTWNLHIQGGGSYQVGGEVAVVQEMRLNITVTLGVDPLPDALLESGRIAGGAGFPEIDIQLMHKDPPSPIHVYSLILLATPAEDPSVEFRRGDSNGDGAVDISDAIHMIWWLFSGETTACRDASDGNGDGDEDITDAIFVITYLFLDGKAPPDPGPAVCGTAPDSGLGCLHYTACNPTD